MDNQAAIAIAEQNAPTGRSKHITVRYFYVRQLVESGNLILRYVPTSLQLADIFTKALPADKFLPLKYVILSGSDKRSGTDLGTSSSPSFSSGSSSDI